MIAPAKNLTQINIPKGKIVTVSFDAHKHQEFEILDPEQTIICNKKSIANSPFIYENQSFSTKKSGNYSIIIKSNRILQEVVLTECNEIFVGFETTKYYNFKSNDNAEISLVIH